MTVSAASICQSGVAYPVAIEIARQINAGAGGVTAASANQLIASGIQPSAAKELVAQITAQVFNSGKLAVAGFHPEVAVQMKKTSGL